MRVVAASVFPLSAFGFRLCLMFDPNDRRSLVRLGTLFEGGLALLALGLAWVVGVDPWARLSWNWMAVAWGLAGVVPPFVLFLLAQRFPVGPLLPIKRFLVELLGPLLVACRWYDLVILALLGVAIAVLF